MNIIMNLNSPIENMFGFTSDQQSSRESGTKLGKVVNKLNELNQKFNNKATIMPSNLTGMILVLKISESEFTQLAQAINAKYSYDSISRIGYIESFQFSKSA